MGPFCDHFFGQFLKWSLGPVFDRFGTPKRLQKETQKGAKDTSYQKVKIELSLQPELDPEGCGGAENHNVFDVFLEPSFGIAFGAHFCDFGSLLGSLLETILVTFWGTIFASILRPPKNIEKGRESSRRPVSTVHAPPPPRTPPP